MDWNNVNLTEQYERDQPLVDPLSFETLLLEITCNIPDINQASVRAHFEYRLHQIVTTAREVYYANEMSIVNQALKEKQDEEL